MKKIIVNADDFGLTAGTNRAIEQLLNSRAITSATLMANGPAFEDAVNSIHAANHKWAIGVHINVTQFSPVGDGLGLEPLLNEQGQFRGRNALIRAWLTGRLSESAIQSEIRAQFDTCLAKGVVPDHMDSHQHAHAVPVVKRAMEKVANEKGVPIRILRPHMQNTSWKRLVKARLLKSLAGRTNSRKKANMIDGMTLVSIFSTDQKPSLKAYSELLDACPGEVLELMVHPSDVDSEHRASTSISEVSLLDYRVLSSSEWLEFQRNSGHDFVTFADFS